MNNNLGVFNYQSPDISVGRILLLVPFLGFCFAYRRKRNLTKGVDLYIYMFCAGPSALGVVVVCSNAQH
jgi:hypothetical protein